MIIEIKWYIRLIGCIIMCMLFGFAWVGLFFWITGWEYIIGFWQDSLIMSAFTFVIIVAIVETIIAVYKKHFKKIKLSIMQTDEVISDAPIHFEQNHIDGWLFLTSQSLILKFWSRKMKAQNYEIIFKLDDITSINKLEDREVSISTNNKSYKISMGKNEKWFSLVKEKVEDKEKDTI